MSINSQQNNRIKAEDAARPLLGDYRENETRPSWRAPAVLLGLLVGIAVQLATVGITTLIIATLGSDILQHGKISAVGLPIMYNAVTLPFIWATSPSFGLSANHLGRQSSEQKVTEEDSHFKDTLMQFEGHFVLGSVFGAGMLWLLVDLLMGTTSKMIFALLPLNVILFVYMLLGFVADLTKDEPEEEEEDICTIRSTGGSRYRNGPYDV